MAKKTKTSKGPNPLKAKNKTQPQSSPSPPKPSSPSTAYPPTSGDPLFFWKEDHPETGHLCQWYPSPFVDTRSMASQNSNETIETTNYKSAEQYMMNRKALRFSDHATASKILTTTSPRKQKMLGRQVEEFDAGQWDTDKEKVAEDGNWLKSNQCYLKSGIDDSDTADRVPLKRLLLETGDRMLVQASEFDRVWGIGFKEEDALLRSRREWGQNLLGKALMRVRTRLREQQAREDELDSGMTGEGSERLKQGANRYSDEFEGA